MPNLVRQEIEAMFHSNKLRQIPKDIQNTQPQQNFLIQVWISNYNVKSKNKM